MSAFRTLLGWLILLVLGLFAIVVTPGGASAHTIQSKMEKK